MDYSKEKQLAAFLSICSNALLITLKLIVGFLTGSLSIISEALHSLSDIAASFIAFISVKKSAKPADKEHPFGHGKFEELSGFFEGLLICAIAVFIFHTAIIKFVKPSAEPLETFWGIVVMTFSVVLNIFVSKYLFKVGEKANSIAITVDAEHLRIDVLSSLAVLVGLLLIKLTGLYVIDTIFAFVVAVIIAFTGIKLTLEAAKGLLDETLPQKDLDLLNNILNKYIGVDIVAVKYLKTRKAGSEKMIELVIIVHKNMTIRAGHDICNKIEREIAETLQGAKIFIHLEPCEDNCEFCH